MGIKLKDIIRIENPMVLADPFPDEYLYPNCPICESDNYDLVYFDDNDKLIGCSECIYSKSNDEYAANVEEDRLADKEYWKERKYEQEKEERLIENL